MFKFPDYQMANFQHVWGRHAKYRMCTSTLEPMHLNEIVEGFSLVEANEWQHLSLGYSSDRGDPLLRDIIAQDYPGLSADNIVIFAGAQEASFCAMVALLGAEGLALASTATNSAAPNVAAVVPGFEPLIALPQSLGAKIRLTALAPTESGWVLPVEQLLSNISGDCALTIINFPNNPTGALISKETQAKIINASAAMNTWLFSDEVFRGLEYNPDNRLPTAASLYDKAISLGSIAKPYGLGGVRVGWLAAQNQQFIERVIRIKRSLSVCTGYIDEWLAKTVLLKKDQLQEKNRHYMTQQLNLIEQSLGQLQTQFRWIPPQAGIIAYPALIQHTDSESFASSLVQKNGVLLLPGSSFLGDFPQHFRLGFGLKNFAEAWDFFCEELAGKSLKF